MALGNPLARRRSGTDAPRRIRGSSRASSSGPVWRCRVVVAGSCRAATAACRGRRPQPRSAASSGSRRRTPHSALEEALLLLVEQLVRPVDRGSQRRLASGRCRDAPRADRGAARVARAAAPGGSAACAPRRARSRAAARRAGWQSSRIVSSTSSSTPAARARSTKSSSPSSGEGRNGPDRLACDLNPLAAGDEQPEGRAASASWARSVAAPAEGARRCPAAGGRCCPRASARDASAEHLARLLAHLQRLRRPWAARVPGRSAARARPRRRRPESRRSPRRRPAARAGSCRCLPAR